jgi:hypothetical protein
MQCSKTLSVISSTDWERTIRAMKLHQYFEFGPTSQDPFSFFQIQIALDTVYVKNKHQGAALYSICKSQQHIYRQQQGAAFYSQEPATHIQPAGGSCFLLAKASSTYTDSSRELLSIGKC